MNSNEELSAIGVRVASPATANPHHGSEGYDVDASTRASGTIKGCLVLVGKDIELDAVGRQFEPYPSSHGRVTAGCIGGRVSVLVARVSCRSQTVVVLKPSSCGELEPPPLRTS